LIHGHCADTGAAGASQSALSLHWAFIANVASFVLPISNPDNLVVYGARMPHFAEWLRQFALPSIAASVVTGVALRLTQRRALQEEKLEANRSIPEITGSGLSARATGGGASVSAAADTRPRAQRIGGQMASSGVFKFRLWSQEDCSVSGGRQHEFGSSRLRPDFA
jgi:hypothetical protein